MQPVGLVSVDYRRAVCRGDTVRAPYRRYSRVGCPGSILSLGSCFSGRPLFPYPVGRIVSGGKGRCSYSSNPSRIVFAIA